jgi:hypothetical protein
MAPPVGAIGVQTRPCRTGGILVRRSGPLLLLFLAPLSLLAIPACESEGEAPALRPEPGSPVYHARVSPDPEAGTLEASWTISFVPAEGVGSVSLLLARGLEIRFLEGEGVAGYREEPFDFVPDWRQVVLELDEARADGSVTVVMEYAGVPALPGSRINQIAPEWVELSVDSGWHPFFAPFDQQMRGELEVVLPESWVISASGPAAFREDRWVIRNELPQIDVAFLGAPGLSRVSGDRVSVLYRDTEPAVVEAVAEAGASCAAYLNERYGEEASLPHTTLVLSDRPANAYARLGHIVLSRVDPDDRPNLSQFLCHELAHFWTMGADPMSVHHWMSEAMAEYVAGRYVRERFGPEVFGQLVERWARVGRGQGPVWTDGMTGRSSDVIMYRTAPYLLSLLEERIGEETFDRFLERYMIRDVATTQELLGHLEEVAGAETGRWFGELLAQGPVEERR